MGRMYSAQFSAVSVNTASAQDLFSLLAATGKPCIIHEVHITQDTSETSEQLVCRHRRLPATFTVGSGGSAPTVVPLNVNDAAAGATVRANDTTQATTSGTAAITRRIADNALNGFHWVFTPETRPVIKPGDGYTIENVANSGGSTLTMSGELIFEEI